MWEGPRPRRRRAAVDEDDEWKCSVLVAARQREQPFDLEPVEGLPRVRAPVARLELRPEVGVQRRQLRRTLSVLEADDLGRFARRLEDRRDAAVDRVRPDPRLEARTEEQLARRDLLDRAVDAEAAVHRPRALPARVPERLVVGEVDPRDVELGRERAGAANVDGARHDGAVGCEAFDPRNAAARRDARALELPLRRVHALDAASLDVDQPDPRVVPGALRRLVGADGGHLAAGPA